MSNRLVQNTHQEDGLRNNWKPHEIPWEVLPQSAQREAPPFESVANRFKTSTPKALNHRLQAAADEAQAMAGTDDRGGPLEDADARKTIVVYEGTDADGNRTGVAVIEERHPQMPKPQIKEPPRYDDTGGRVQTPNEFLQKEASKGVTLREKTVFSLAEANAVSGYAHWKDWRDEQEQFFATQYLRENQSVMGKVADWFAATRGHDPRQTEVDAVGLARQQCKEASGVFEPPVSSFADPDEDGRHTRPKRSGSSPAGLNGW